MVTLAAWQFAVIILVIVLLAIYLTVVFVLHIICEALVPKEWADNYKNFKGK
jgi:hypothetical protein